MSKAKKPGTALSALATAAQNPATVTEIERYRDRKASERSGGLLMEEDVDLTYISNLTDTELIGQIGEDVDAIQELETHSFRHAVRAAACFQELAKREQQRVVEMGERFKKTEWARQTLREYFEGKIAPSTMRLYERVSSPDNQVRAREFQSKIEIVRELQARNVEAEDFANGVSKSGITQEELSYIPEKFSLRTFANYIRYLDSKDKGRSLKADSPKKRSSSAHLPKSAVQLAGLEQTFAEHKESWKTTHPEKLKELEKVRKEIRVLLRSYAAIVESLDVSE